MSPPIPPITCPNDDVSPLSRGCVVIKNPVY